ncbi:MAG: endonuclease III, partial [Methanomicrobiales archaeon]|nr:endonuclease III [Methanomicrobiales archaeon]
RAVGRADRVRIVMAILEGYLGVPHQSAKRPRPLDMLIATVLSQNTNDKNSHRAYTRLREAYPQWPAVAHAPLARLKSLLKVGGMADQKARRIKEILKTVESRFGGYDLSAISRWTSERIMNELTSMNGIGPKTAACVCLFSLGRDIFPVDTHVHRLCTRLALVPGGGSPARTFQLMQDLVPRRKSYSFHTNLIRFGRRVCRSHNPACAMCPLYALCCYEGKKGRAGAQGRHSKADHDFMLLDNVS